jgi:hypothetical protein
MSYEGPNRRDWMVRCSNPRLQRTPPLRREPLSGFGNRQSTDAMMLQRDASSAPRMWRARS